MKTWILGSILLAGAAMPAVAATSIVCTPAAGPQEVNVPYTITCTASGGATTPYIWDTNGTALSASLGATLTPDGTATNATATLTGTPTTAGTFPFTIRATDSDAAPTAGTQNFTGVIAALPTFSCTPATLPNEVGSAYSTTCTASGGTGTYNWTKTGTTPNLTLSAATGATTTLSGTPNAAGTFTYAIKLTDSASTPQTATQNFTSINIAATVSATCTPTGALEVGVAYTVNCSLTGGVPPYTWVTTGTVPSGLGTLTPAGSTASTTASITGTFTTAQTAAFSIKVTDSGSTNLSSTAATSLGGTIIAAPAFTCTNSSTPVEVNVPYSTTCNVTGGTGTAAYTFSINPGSLPAGITVSGTTATSITLSGTPTAAGATSYTVRLVDSVGVAATQAFTGTIAALPTFTCSPATSPNEVGSAYSTTCTASGGTGTYNWATTGTTPNLTLSAATGATTTLSGTPNAAGTFTYAITLTDSASTPQTATQNFTSINIAATVSATCTPTGTLEVGVVYTVNCTLTGGVPPYTWTTTGTIPSGLGALTPAGSTASTTASITGTFTTAQTAAFSIKVTDSGSTNLSSTAPTSLGGTIIAKPIISCFPTAGPTQIGVPYSATCNASGGTGAYTFSTGTLPGGLFGTQNSPTQYTVFGTPTTAGAYSYNVQVTDSATTPQTVPQAYSGTIVAGLTASCLPAAGPTEVGVFYTATCTASNSTSPYNWSISTGSLPSGLGLSSATGASVTISGTPTSAGGFGYSVRVADSSNPIQTYTQSYAGSITAAPVVTCSPSSGPVEVNVPYSSGCSVSGGTAPYTWTISSGALPTGITGIPGSGATRTLTGSPTTSGAYAYTVTVTDSAVNAVGTSVPQSGSLPVSGTTAALPTVSCVPNTGPVEVNIPYSTTCTASNGSLAYSWTTTGTVPPGLSLGVASGTGNNTIVFSGTPTTAGTYSYGIRATDTASTPQSATASFNPTIIGAPSVSCAPATAPTEVNVLFSTTCTATGGNGSYVWTAPSAPAGVTVGTPSGTGNNTVVVSGRPTTAGAVNFNIVATDTATPAQFGQQNFSGSVIGRPTVSCVPTSGPVEVGVPYTANCTAASGAGPYTWSVSAGAFPTGVAFSSTTGTTTTITGTPTTSGAFAYTVQVTDSAVNSAGAADNQTSTAPQAFSGTILASPTMSCTPTTGPTEVGIPYSTTCTASLGNSSYTWSISAGSLPSGLTLGAPTGTGNKTVVISGTPTVAGAFSFSVRAADTASTPQLTTAVTIAGTITAIPTVTCTPATAPTEVNVLFSTTCTATGGNGSYVWTAPSAPAGITVGTASGTGNNTVIVSGRPTTAGAVNFNIVATDTATPAQSGQQNFTGVVVARPTLSCTPTSGPVEIGVPYTATCTAALGAGTYTWSRSAGTFPAGIDFSSTTGTTTTITGTPTTAAPTYAYTVQVTDSAVDSLGTADNQASTTPQAYSGGILAQPTMSCTPTTGPTEVGIPYSTTCTASLGNSSYTWSISAGSLPSGLTLGAPTGTGNKTVVISGTPTVAGAFSFAVRAADTASTPQLTTAVTIAGTITAVPTVTCTPATAPTEVNVLFSTTCTASGGNGSYVWTAPGAPSAITVGTATGTGNNTVVVSGRPAAAGVVNFNIVATDTATPAQFGQQNFTGVVVARPTLSCTPTSGPVEIGVPYTATCTAALGTGAYTWSRSAGTFPAGIDFSSTTGTTTTITGIPTTATALYNYTVQVTDSAVDSLGAADKQASTTPQAYSGTILALPTMSCTNTTGPTEVGIFFSSTCTATGGNSSYTWSISTGSLPSGLTQGATTGSTFTVSGTPTVAGAFSFKVRAADTASTPQLTAEVPFTGTIIDVPAVSCTVTTAPTEVNVLFSTTCTATRGNGTYVWTAPRAPAGVTVGTATGTGNNTVVVSGRPTTAGVVDFDIVATDTSTPAQFGKQSFTGVVVARPTLSCTPTSGPVEIGVPYTATCTAALGTGAYTWSRSAGTFPAGIDFSSTTGTTTTITGIPTTASASYNYTVQVTDSAANSAGAPDPQTSTTPQAFSSVVGILASPTMSCTNTATPTEVNVFYSTKCTAAGGNSSYTWSISSGSLPSGLSLGTPTGTGQNTVVISGTPTVAGAFSYAVRAADTATLPQLTTPVTFASTIVPTPTVTCTRTRGPNDPTAGPTEVGVSFSTTCTAAGGTPGSGYTWTTGALPAGLVLTPAVGGLTATVSGLPTAAGTGNFQIQATDNAVSGEIPPAAAFNKQTSAPVVFTGTVAAAPVITCTTTGTPPAGGPTQVNVAYSSACKVTGGTADYIWDTVGALPTGITLSATTGGSISVTGTPLTPQQTYSYQVRVTDSAVNSAGTASPQSPISALSAVYTGKILDSVSLTCTNPSFVTEVGVGASTDCLASGGQTPYTFSVVNGTSSGTTALFVTSPTGATTIRSLPTASGTFAPVVHVVDNAVGKPQTADLTLALSVAPNATVTCDSEAKPTQVGIAYSNTCKVSDGLAPYTWLVTGKLPDGLTGSADGPTFKITGTPTKAAAFDYYLQVQDGKYPLADASVGPKFTGSIRDAVSVTCTDSVGPVEVRVDYSKTCTITGGQLPYIPPTLSGTVPPGLGVKPGSAANTWVISGQPLDLTPAQNYPYSYSLSVTDNSKQTKASALFQGTVVQSPSITCSQKDNQLSVGVQYSNTCTVLNGSPDYTWTVDSANLPPGITTDAATGSTFTLSGIPSKRGVFNYTVAVKDSFGGLATVPLNAVVSRIVFITAVSSKAEDFVLGGAGGVITLTVSNDTANAVADEASISFPLPPGLVRGSINAPVGDGWDCSASTDQMISCVRSDGTALSAKNSGKGVSSYPPIAVPIKVSDAACPSPVKYSASVSLKSAIAGSVAQLQDVFSDGIVKAQGCLLITKTHTSDFAAGTPDQPGKGVYTITVANASKVSMSGTVTVTDTLSAGLVVDPVGFAADNKVNGWTCSAAQFTTASPWVVTCSNQDSIDAGAQYKPITLAVSIPGASCAFVSDQAFAAFGDVPQSVATDATTIAGNNCLFLSARFTPNTGAPAGDVQPINTAYGPSLAPRAVAGTAGSYTITVSNTGAGPFSNPASVTLTLPAGLSLVTPVNSPGWTCDGVTGAVTCKLDPTTPLPGGASSTVTLNVVADATVSCVTTATLDLNVGDSPTQSQDVATSVRGAACLTLTRTQPTLGRVGDSSGTYTLVVGNPGDAIVAPTVKVVETLPKGLTPTKVVGDGWTCESIQGQSLSCKRSSDISATGTYAPITVTYDVAAAACPSILATAKVTSNDVPQSYTTDVLPISGCMKVRSAPSGDFLLGPNSGAYTISTSYIGLGDTPLSGQVTVVDRLFLGLTPTPQVESADLNPGWVCTRTQNAVDLTWSVSCTRPAPGSYGPITIPVDVGPDACPSQISTAEVLLERLSQDSVNTTVNVGAGCPVGKLTLSTSVSPTTLSPGKAATYSLTVTNSGTDTITSEVIVKDVFNLGLTPAPISENGWDCSASAGQIVTCRRTSDLAPNDSYKPIRIAVTPDIQACPTGEDRATVQLGGKVLIASQSTRVNLRGCITVSPTSLTFAPTVLGTPTTSSVTLTSNDAGALQVTVPPLPSTSAYSLSVPGCDDPTTPCVKTLTQGQSVVFKVAYNPRCIGSGSLQAGTVSYSTDLPSTGSIPLTGSGILASAPVFYKLGDASFTSLDGSTVNPVDSINLGLQATPGYCRDNASDVTAKVVYSKLVRPADATPVQYDAGVADCKTDGCVGTFTTGTVAGDITLEARFKDKAGNDVPYPGGAPTAKVTLPELKPVLTAVTKGAVSASSFLLNMSGYSTPRTATEACFKFAAAPGTLLNAGELNNCFAKDAIDIYYERNSSLPNGSKFTTAVTFSFAGDANAIGTVESWLSNAKGTSDHFCMDFKTGVAKAGACQ